MYGYKKNKYTSLLIVIHSLNILMDKNELLSLINSGCYLFFATTNNDNPKGGLIKFSKI